MIQAGEYVYMNKHGELVRGAGNGIAGAVSVLCILLKEHDKPSHDYIKGKIRNFRSVLVEEEYNHSTCF